MSRASTQPATFRAATLISGALIGHRLYFAWGLSMVGLSVPGTLLAAVLLAARYVEAF